MPHVYGNSKGGRRGGHAGGLGGLGGNHRSKGCCSYQEAGKALARGNGRLALRFVRMDIKARLGII